MHLPLIILSSIVLSTAAAVTDFTDIVTPDDHGRVVHFYRVRPFLFMNIPYIHKGLIFFPSVCGTSGPGIDSVRISSPERAHVIHLWGTGSKSSAIVRIDPLEDVILDDPFEVLPEFGECISADMCIGRALSQVGKKHRGLKYNLIGNNCGNFVAWAKLGFSEADTQFWDLVERTVNSTRSGLLKKMTRWVKNKVRRYYSKHEYEGGVHKLQTDTPTDEANEDLIVRV